MQISPEDRAKHIATFNSLHPENGFLSGVAFDGGLMIRATGQGCFHEVEVGHANAC